MVQELHPTHRRYVYHPQNSQTVRHCGGTGCVVINGIRWSQPIHSTRHTQVFKERQHSLLAKPASAYTIPAYAVSGQLSLKRSIQQAGAPFDSTADQYLGLLASSVSLVRYSAVASRQCGSSAPLVALTSTDGVFRWVILAFAATGLVPGIIGLALWAGAVQILGGASAYITIRSSPTGASVRHQLGQLRWTRRYPNGFHYLAVGHMPTNDDESSSSLGCYLAGEKTPTYFRGMGSTSKSSSSTTFIKH